MNKRRGDRHIAGQWYVIGGYRARLEMGAGMAYHSLPVPTTRVLFYLPKLDDYRVRFILYVGPARTPVILSLSRFRRYIHEKFPEHCRRLVEGAANYGAAGVAMNEGGGKLAVANVAVGGGEG